MIRLTSNAQAEKLIKNGVLSVDDDIEIAFNGFSIRADIRCENIISKGCKRNINCGNINCWNINCGSISCNDIHCRNIDCWNIDCGEINCGEINCGNINCGDIHCRNIDYYAFAIAYKSFKCKSAKGKRGNGFHKCLDSEIVYTKDRANIKEALTELTDRLCPKGGTSLTRGEAIVETAKLIIELTPEE